jgi:GNAT superfamily N-acetyltransferase
VIGVFNWWVTKCENCEILMSSFPTLVVRNGKASDIDSIMRIVGKVVEDMRLAGNFQWTSSYPTEDTFLQDIAGQSLHVGLVDKNLVSFITLDRNQPTQYEPISWSVESPAMVLHRFAVAPEVRRLRIAHRMEEFACEHTRKQGLAYLRTDTNSANTVMQSFLTNRHYQFAGRLYFPKCDNPFFCYDKVLA